MRRVSACLLIAALCVPTSLFAGEVAFKKTKQEYFEGDKRKIRDVALVFTDDQVLVQSKDRKTAHAAIPYKSITELTYERTTHPRVKTAIFVSPLFLLSKGKKHWFTIMYEEGGESQFVLFQLDKKEYQQVVAAAEARVGKKVERVIE